MNIPYTPTLKFRRYKPRLTVVTNARKGVCDVDTVKGCTLGMAAYPNGGCYGLCYACSGAMCRGIDFRTGVSRKVYEADRVKIEYAVKKHHASWFRIGTMGDPCHDWPLTVEVCEWLGKIKTPVIVTKHWIALSDSELQRLEKCGAVVNTSISPMDTTREIAVRLFQYERIKMAGIKSVLRVVSAKFGETANGKMWGAVQKSLFDNHETLDNPLRIPASDWRVRSGDILVERHRNLGGGSTISIANRSTYIGTCRQCPDQCGAPIKKKSQK